MSPDRGAVGPIAVTLLVTEALEALSVRYVIGGPMASAVHGVARSTMDVDVIADLRVEHVEPLAERLGGAFYADAAAMRDAVLRRASFNLIHLGTMFKVDVFVSKGRPFDEIQLERRAHQKLLSESDRSAYVATAEDMVLAKLEWYRKGGEVSDGQWQDVVGIVSVQGDRLDVDYLRHWARVLGVSDLLDRALET